MGATGLLISPNVTRLSGGGGGVVAERWQSGGGGGAVAGRWRGGGGAVAERWRSSGAGGQSSSGGGAAGQSAKRVICGPCKAKAERGEAGVQRRRVKRSAWVESGGRASEEKERAHGFATGSAAQVQVQVQVQVQRAWEEQEPRRAGVR
jgi:hypothetical protein